MSELGADAGFPIAELESTLLRVDFRDRRRPDLGSNGYLASAERVYLDDGGDSEWVEKIREGVERLRSADLGPTMSVDARAIVHELRLVKDADELALLRRASELSARGHILAMAAARPGRYEFRCNRRSTRTASPTERGAWLIRRSSRPVRIRIPPLGEERPADPRRRRRPE